MVVSSQPVKGIHVFLLNVIRIAHAAVIGIWLVTLWRDVLVKLQLEIQHKHSGELNKAVVKKKTDVDRKLNHIKWEVI